MKQNIKCCDSFTKVRHHFDWLSYQDDNSDKVYCMPLIKNTKKRVNFCPICGGKIRGIELRE